MVLTVIGKYVIRCEPFDTYPRTYDLLHAAGLFSVERKRYSLPRREICSGLPLTSSFVPLAELILSGSIFLFINLSFVSDAIYLRSCLRWIGY